MRRCRWILLSMVLTLVLPSIPWGAEAPRSAAVARCREDLARRLKIEAAAIRPVRVDAVRFPDGSLGLTRPGAKYEQVITPGYRVVLEAGHDRYHYAIASGAPHYAGSEASWGLSVAYVAERDGDPNLNGSLVQLSLVGTHPAVILRGVDTVYPQPNGALFATRRTSRSGFDLLYLGAHGKQHAERLAAGFEFDRPVQSPDGKQWAALSRPTLGLFWELTVGHMEPGAKAHAVPLPSQAKPLRLWWRHERPILGVERACYELTEGGTGWQRLTPNAAPDAADFMLNKSQSLAVEQTPQGVKVARVWFTGEENVLAVLPELRLEHADLSPGHRFLLVVGDAGDETRAYTVDVGTGEVMDTAHADVRLLERAHRPWQE